MMRAFCSDNRETGAFQRGDDSMTRQRR